MEFAAWVEEVAMAIRKMVLIWVAIAAILFVAYMLFGPGGVSVPR
jgi:hypothetical protein